MRIWIIGFAAFIFAAAWMAGPAPAQDDQARPRVARRAPLRIEVQPSRPPVRKCADWLVIEHRYAGDTSCLERGAGGRRNNTRLR
jgi:hypothetical protein